MATSKQTYALAGKALEKFKSLYRQHWEEKSKGKLVKELELNAVRDKYNMVAIIEDIGTRQLWELIDYYFENYNNPELTWFVYNYERILKDKQWVEEDQRKIAELRRETNRRVIEGLKKRIEQ